MLVALVAPWVLAGRRWPLSRRGVTELLPGDTADYTVNMTAHAPSCPEVRHWCGRCCRERAARSGARFGALRRRLLAQPRPHLRVAVIGNSVARFNNFGVVSEYMPRNLHLIMQRAEINQQTADKLKSVWRVVVSETAAALAHLHSKNIGHYALHPRNVRFDAQLRIKLTDYGRTADAIAQQMIIGSRL